MWGERDGMSGVALMGASKFGYLQTPRPTGTNGDGRTGTDGHGRHVTACHGAHAMHKFARLARACTACSSSHKAALAFLTMLNTTGTAAGLFSWLGRAATQQEGEHAWTRLPNRRMVNE